jgi:hypothetical protein
MRILTLALAAASVLSFLTVQAEPAEAVGLCAYNDVYNNMGGPGSECEGVFCMGYSGGDWRTCVPPHPCEVYSCPPPPIDPIVTSTASSSAGTGLCLAGDLYNNQAGQPSSGCDGAVCTGYSNGDWGTCVLDCTADGCPRIEDPCRYLMCQPPFDP